MNKTAERHRNDKLTQLNLTIEDVKSDLLNELRKADSKGWKITLVVIPVILTSLLGLFIWRVETNITERIQKEAMLHEAWLKISQEFFTQRFEAYRRLLKEVYTLETLIREANSRIEKRVDFYESIGALNNLKKSERLLISKELYRDIHEMWRLTRKAARERPISPEKVKTTSKLKEGIEARMRQELQVDKLSKLGESL